MPKQILLVDDSVTIHRVVELTFAREDYKVIAVKSGDDGLNKARELKPDIVLADAGMMGKTGYDVCAALRADAQLAATPCLILTGNFAPYDDVKGQRAGADGFVVKPFETQAMIDKVADAIARRARGNGAVEPATSRTTTTPMATVPTGLPTAPRPSVPGPAAMPSVDDWGVRPPSNVRPATLPPPPLVPAVPRPAPPPPSSTSRTMMGIPAPTIPAPPPPAPAPKPIVVESLAKPLSLVTDEAPDEKTDETPLAPPPSIAPPRAAMPASVPQMPRPSMIPHTPTPQPAPRSTAPMPVFEESSPPRGPQAPPPQQPPPPRIPAPRATLMGMPAVNPGTLPPGAVPLPPSMKPAVTPPAPAPSAPTSSPTSTTDTASRLGGAWAPPPPPPPPSPSRDVSPLVAAVAERAVGEVAARSSEHEAIAKLSREVIERIVWEVVPELAETIIREQLDRLVAERQK